MHDRLGKRAVVVLILALVSSNPASAAGTVSYSGYTSYNIYDGIPASSVYCNLDPAAYGMMVTALRTDLAEAYANQFGVSACGMCATITSKTTGGGNGLPSS